jgi:hypothetical protein
MQPPTAIEASTNRGDCRSLTGGKGSQSRGGGEPLPNGLRRRAGEPLGGLLELPQRSFFLLEILL